MLSQDKQTKLYWLAACSIFGANRAEEWLDENSDKLSMNINNLIDAKEDIRKVNAAVRNRGK